MEREHVKRGAPEEEDQMTGSSQYIGRQFRKETRKRHNEWLMVFVLSWVSLNMCSLPHVRPIEGNEKRYEQSETQNLQTDKPYSQRALP